MWNARSSAALALACVVAMPALANAQENGPAFFETNIRPLFARQCQACHSTAAGMGGLRIDSRENLIKGGARGPAVVPGKPSESLLMNAVMQSGSLKMPPSGKLKDGDIALVERWIEMGAPWGMAEKEYGKPQYSAAETGDKAPAPKYWAFVPPVAAKAPAVQNAS